MALSSGSAVKGATTSRLLNRLAYDMANKASDVTTAATGDVLVGVDVSDDYAVKYFDAANIAEIMGTSQADQTKLNSITATAAEINAAADVSTRFVTIADEDTAILAANSGKTHVIPNVSADRTFTLPAASAGLEYVFVAAVGAADGHDWIFAAADTSDLFYGGVLSVDTDAGPATVAAVVADQSDDDAFQVNLPQGGTWIRMISDGSYWYVTGTVMSAAAPAFS